MKKLLLILISVVCLCSCTTQTYTDKNTDKWTELQANGIKVVHNPQGLDDDYTMIEITYNGNSHEFVQVAYGLAHWPSCKYCTSQNILEE